MDFCDGSIMQIVYEQAILAETNRVHEFQQRMDRLKLEHEQQESLLNQENVLLREFAHLRNTMDRHFS